MAVRASSYLASIVGPSLDSAARQPAHAHRRPPIRTRHRPEQTNTCRGGGSWRKDGGTAELSVSSHNETHIPMSECGKMSRSFDACWLMHDLAEAAAFEALGDVRGCSSGVAAASRSLAADSLRQPAIDTASAHPSIHPSTQSGGSERPASGVALAWGRSRDIGPAADRVSGHLCAIR